MSLSLLICKPSWDSSGDQKRCLPSLLQGTVWGQHKTPLSVVPAEGTEVGAQAWVQLLPVWAASGTGKSLEEAGTLGVPKEATFAQDQTLTYVREPGVMTHGGRWAVFLKEWNGAKQAVLRSRCSFLIIDHWLLFTDAPHGLRHTVGVQSMMVG